MRAGTLRHWIQVQVKSVTRDEYGAEVISWVTEFSTWADINPLMGREYLAASQVQAEISHRIRVRYRDDETISPGRRVLFGERIFDVLSVQNARENGREWVLMCKEQIDE